MSKLGEPFMPWQGGKRRLIPELLEVFPKSIERYREPFLGGGSVFLHLAHAGRLTKGVLSDINPSLMAIWGCLRHAPDAFIEKAEEFWQLEDTREEYYRKRDALASRVVIDKTDARSFKDACMVDVPYAATAFYVAHHNFNGKWAESHEGRVTSGYRKPSKGRKRAAFSEGHLRYCAELLRVTKCHIVTANAFKWTDTLGGRDLIYCDPPYHNTTNKYVGVGFDESKQALLRWYADMWGSQGGKVVVSNSDTPFIRETWKGWEFKEVTAAQLFAGDKTKRVPRKELIIFNK